MSTDLAARIWPRGSPQIVRCWFTQFRDAPGLFKLICRLAQSMARAPAPPGLTPAQRRRLWVMSFPGAATPFIEFVHQDRHLLRFRSDLWPLFIPENRSTGGWLSNMFAPARRPS